MNALDDNFPVSKRLYQDSKSFEEIWVVLLISNKSNIAGKYEWKPTHIPMDLFLKNTDQQEDNITEEKVLLALKDAVDHKFISITNINNKPHYSIVPE